jgi:hypothetical protein
MFTNVNCETISNYGKIDITKFYQLNCIKYAEEHMHIQYIHITLWQVFRAFKSECTKHIPMSPSIHLESPSTL